MRKSLFQSCVLATLVVVAGCNRSENVPARMGSDSGPKVSSLPVSKESAPAVVVAAFLDALRGGDDATAEQLLTATAREQTASHNLPVQAPGAPTATYLIGKTTRIDGGVQVGSRWTERSENGEPLVYDIDWVLRQQAEGWRVAGMATLFTPEGELVYINFEDVADMLNKWDEADAELARQQEEAAALQARQRTEERRR
ncbi:MAG: hypothetical protein CMJ64_26695 [Planctomycetaceae bacterium]|nr:hypothetical protein [Planctomycetaceae bacterium]